MLNVDFINTGEIEYDEDSYRDKKDINNWMMTIKNLVKNIYTYEMSDAKIREILMDDGKNWKVYAFAKGIEKNNSDEDKKNTILVESIIIYRITVSAKEYKIYNLYQIGAIPPKSESDTDVDNFIKVLNETIIDSMKEINKDDKKRKIFYENIRQSNVLYSVYYDMLTKKRKEEIKIKMVQNGTYKDGEEKILILMRLKGKKKFKLYDDLNTSTDFNNLIKDISPSTPITKRYFTQSKPVFENKEYKIYDEIPYLQMEAVAKLHNENMVKQRETSYFRKISDKSKSVFLVAKDNEGQIVGYILTRPEYSPFINTGLYNVMNFVGIVVSPKMRGQGLGRKLIGLMEEQVFQMKQFEYIYGHVRFSNASAQKLYRKMGYSLFPIGRYKDTNEIKYRLFKRLKSPNIGRALKTYKNEIIIGFTLIMGHELIHLVRDY